MRRILLFLALPALFLSGCADSGKSSGSIDDDGTTDITNSTLEPITASATGTIVAGAGTPVVSFANGADALAFDVPDNATLLYVEMSWSSQVIALDLCVHAPADGFTQGIPICGIVQDGGSPGMPKSPVTVTIADPEIGSGWQVSPYPDGPAAEQPFKIAYTIFLNQTAVPDGYTALA